MMNHGNQCARAVWGGFVKKNLLFYLTGNAGNPVGNGVRVLFISDGMNIAGTMIPGSGNKLYFANGGTPTFNAAGRVWLTGTVPYAGAPNNPEPSSAHVWRFDGLVSDTIADPYNGDVTTINVQYRQMLVNRTYGLESQRGLVMGYPAQSFGYLPATASGFGFFAGGDDGTPLGCGMQVAAGNGFNGTTSSFVADNLYWNACTNAGITGSAQDVPRPVATVWKKRGMITVKTYTGFAAVPGGPLADVIGGYTGTNGSNTPFFSAATGASVALGLTKNPVSTLTGLTTSAGWGVTAVIVGTVSDATLSAFVNAVFNGVTLL